MREDHSNARSFDRLEDCLVELSARRYFRRVLLVLEAGAPSHLIGGDTPAPSHVNSTGKLPPGSNAGLVTFNFPILPDVLTISFTSPVCASRDSQLTRPSP